MEIDILLSDPAPVEDEVEEPSVLDYAREQGICIDYTTDLSRCYDLGTSLELTSDREIHDPFDDVLTNAAAAAEVLTKQKLGLNKEGALFLKSTLALQGPLDYDPLALETQRRIRDLKQELPILKTDAELDMLSFGTKVVPDFEDLQKRIPFEIIDEDKDEGLGWPAKYHSLPLRYDAAIKDEKLAVTKEAMTFLQNALTDDITPEEHTKIMEEALEGRRDLVPRHLSPPLLPISPPMTPYVPSSPVSRLPLIPEGSDSAAAEAKALEERIMAVDSLMRPNSGSSESMLFDPADLDKYFDAGEAEAAQSPPRVPKILKRRPDDLKVEGPLTPPMLSDSPTKKLKSVSFSTLIQVGDAMEPWSNEDHSRTLGSQSSITDELHKQIGPIVSDLNRRVENEKLTGADTIARVDVPPLDFELPVAPWDEFSQHKKGKRHADITELETQMGFLQQVKRNELDFASPWRGISDLDLRWGWFASPNPTILLDEKLHGETDFNKIQAELSTGGIAVSSGEVWKREGLRILEEGEYEDEDEEDIRPAEVEDSNDIDLLIRKRRLEWEEQDAITEVQYSRKQAAAARLEYPTPHQPKQEKLQPASMPISGASGHSSLNPDSKQSPKIALRQSRTGKKNQTPAELMFGGFAASMALHRFMESQGKAIAAADSSHQVGADPVRSVHNQSLEAQELPPAPKRLSSGGTEHTPSKRTEPQMVPPFDLPASSCIISTALLQRRVFVREIERLHPKADLIYRDYALSHSICSGEADIILSPSTGMILTTLQQIKQAPLPGQVALSPVRERVVRLQLRYERLLVLVSEGLRGENSDSRPEDARDKKSLKNLELFAAQLESIIAVEYVLGGDKELAKATVENMGRYGLPHGGRDMQDITLIPHESTWEVFLCRAGLNPFAAQFIIAYLKEPTIVRLSPLQTPPELYTSQDTIAATGLSTFILMDREERAKHFQAIMGGRRILDTVSTGASTDEDDTDESGTANLGFPSGVEGEIDGQGVIGVMGVVCCALVGVAGVVCILPIALPVPVPVPRTRAAGCPTPIPILASVTVPVPILDLDCILTPTIPFAPTLSSASPHVLALPFDPDPSLSFETPRRKRRPVLEMDAYDFVESERARMVSGRLVVDGLVVDGLVVDGLVVDGLVVDGLVVDGLLMVAGSS
ncbi:hypothetical protein E8E13_003618 [Curvularia kusanoi]|uniref:Uncharacterized protein n=1 Tax=Curvularia kusanoi TaxID=90978 RepID=A0A9P4TG68_CURKU|nr:hypothetical protein E8E13_003618 [Curvularia kusanoi]